MTGADFRRLALLLVLPLGMAACARAQPPVLTPGEAGIAAAVGMPAPIATKARAEGESIARFTINDGRESDVPVKGIVVLTAPERGRDVLAALRTALAGTTWRAYLADDAFGYGPDRVAVLETDDLGFLDIVGTDGINHDIEHAQVVERYRQ